MIHLNNLSFGYGKRNQVFQDLDLTIPGGNIYGLLGKNGAGKTTLLRLIAGLLYPQDGTCEVFGHRPSDRTPDFLAEVMFIPEELYVPNISIPLYEKLYAPFYPKYDASQFAHFLQEFEVNPKAQMQQLSYGQKKKVLLSFGLATNCSLLILDEPTNGLDIPSKGQFRKTLASVIDENRTIIISTHQVRDMTNLIDPIMILEEGKIIFSESLMDVTKQLHFGFQPGMKASEGVLYAERVPGGFIEVTQNTTGMESEPDLEVLFNTVVSNKKTIAQLFEKEVHHE